MSESCLILIPLFVFVLLFIITSVFKKKKKDNRERIKNLPITDIKDAEKISDLIKVKGTLIKIKIIQSYLTKTQCIGYDYKAKKWVSSDRFDNDRSSKRWKTIESIEECYDFYIQDHTGKIKVEAEDISIVSYNNEKKIKKGQISYYENLLLPNTDEYYIVGSIEKDENEIIIRKSVMDNELSIFDLKSYDLFVDIPKWYRIGCAVFLIIIAIIFFAIVFDEALKGLIEKLF
ncbi:hypothetical protein [uncultured Aquimarina sp.]|uniref:hypothetical protein n=1 Tax=uncultured Aquimarina sp. TaxID=575652 RepID=UPI00261F6CBD|nr:hypothetical protein [uncultured Aquimarina sp.]